MTNNILNVAVTGDTGFDIYTQYVEGFISDRARARKPFGAFDVYVPAGASHTTAAFKAIFENSSTNVKVSHRGPIEGESADTSISGYPSYTTMLRSLIELRKYQNVFRVAKVLPISDEITIKEQGVFDNIGVWPPTDADEKQQLQQVPDMLVIFDGAGSWRSYPEAQEDDGQQCAMKLVENVLGQSATAGMNSKPRVIVNLAHDLPAVEQLENGELEFNSNLRFWRTLSEHADQVCVVCSVNVLRREGAWISRRISWEQSVEDIAHELLYFDELKVLSKFKHLIIRFGISGALHISTDEKGRRKGQLVFAPLAKNGIYRNQNEEGFIRGENVLLIAALTKMVADAYSPSTEIGTPDFAEAIKTGLLACMAMFDHGYQVPWDKHYPSEKSGIGLIGKEQFIEKPYSCLQKIFEKGYGNFEHTSGQTLGHVEIPHETMNPSESRFSRNLRKWEILNREVNPPKLKQEDSKGMADAFGHLSRLNVGVGIVMFGKDSVLNKEWITESPEIVSSVLRRPGYLESYEDTPDFITLPFGEKPRIPTRSSRSKSKISVKNVGSRPIYFPIMKFGNLTAIERSDIESLRSMSNLFKTYLEQCKATDEAIAPTSVAVFGPPGAGKSFTVKQLVEEINRDLNNSKRGIDSVEYNVAQFRTVDDLGEAITRASVINNEGRVPLLFFDEFDCKFERQQLGWLKYFLAPMLDGIFYGPRQTIKIGRAIFVFAGGIYSSFNEFANGRSEKTEKRDVQRGALPENGPRETEFRDQKGPDFISRLRGHIDIAPIDAPAGKVKPILRRAMILRGLIEKHKMVTETNGLRIANIDEDIIYALLTMDKYSHGARSMDAILQMCAPIESRIEKASLPSQKQLSMHIDVEEFHARMLRSRSREVPDISPDTDSNADNVVLTGIHPEMNEVADTNETILPPDKAGTEGRHSDDSTVNDQNQ